MKPQPDLKTGDGWALPSGPTNIEMKHDDQLKQIEKLHNSIFRWSGVFMVIWIIGALLFVSALAICVIWLFNHAL